MTNVVTPNRMKSRHADFLRLVENFDGRNGNEIDASPLFREFHNGVGRPRHHPGNAIMYDEPLFNEKFNQLNIFVMVNASVSATMMRDADTWENNTAFYGLLAAAWNQCDLFKIETWNRKHFQSNVRFQLVRSQHLEAFVAGPEFSHHIPRLTLSVKNEGPANRPIRSIVLCADDGDVLQIQNVRFIGALAAAGPLLVEFSGEVKTIDDELGCPYLFRLQAEGTPQCEISDEKLHLYLIDLIRNILSK
jgi:hypothetical protein